MTSSTAPDPPAHPLGRLVEHVEAGLAEHRDGPAWTLSSGELADLLPRLAHTLRELEGVQLAMLAEADRHQVGDPVGAASTAAWWANTTRRTKPAAHRDVALAVQLDSDAHAVTATAVRTGAASADQAAVIVRAVDALPSDLVPEHTRRRAEAHLVELAAHHDPRELRILGTRILEVLAPEIAEEHERRVLEDAERHAAATSTFSMHPDGEGSYLGRFKIPVLAGEMLRKHLMAIAAPRHRAATGAPAASTTERVAQPLRLGRAFTEYIETRSPEDTPKAGGIAATVVVTMTLEALTGACEKAGVLDTGERISAAEARRLACEAGVIPAVLGGPSQVLDLGRKTRFHTGPQRIALALRDGGCCVEGCDWPPGMCHAHHRKPWSRGGSTNVEDGMLICPPHHGLAHDDRYQMKSGASGKVVFTRRT